MKGKARPCTIRGEKRWYVETGDSLLPGRRPRKFFETWKAADAYQKQIDAAPKFTRTVSALVDPTVDLATFSAQWFWDRSTAPKPWRPGTASCYAKHATLTDHAAADALGTIVFGNGAGNRTTF